MRYDALELYDWSDWNHVESLEPWQWAALSVKLPPTKEGIAEAAEHAYRVKMWEHATGKHTGPKSAAGRRHSALRGLKTGLRSIWHGNLEAVVAEFE